MFSFLSKKFRNHTFVKHPVAPRDTQIPVHYANMSKQCTVPNSMPTRNTKVVTRQVLDLVRAD